MALRPGGGGVQTYCRELVAALAVATDAPLVARVQRDVADDLPSEVTAELRPVCDGVHRLLEGHRPAGDVDLVHGLDVDLPIRLRVPSVTTVHDLSVFDVPWAFSRFRAAGERATVARSIRVADELIAVSSFTADAVERRFGRRPTVIPLAPRRDLTAPDDEAVDDVRRRYGLPDRFVLYVGTVEPRKDVPGLADACRRVRVPLVVAGEMQTQIEDTMGITALGYVPAADLAPLYAAATAVAYPSRYEGFGLPPVEAMACGGAVVATAVGALPDVVDPEIPLVTVGDADALADALDAAVYDDDHNKSIRDAGRRSAARLSWDATARATLDVYRALGVSV